MKRESRLPGLSPWQRLTAGRPMSADKANILLLLATCALVLLPHASHLPLWVVPACTVLMGWRAWITFRGNRLPPRWLLLPLALALLLGVGLTYKTIFGREAGVAMLALLLALKMLEIRAKRDLFVVLFLCFFLLLAGYFHSQSLISAALTVVAVIAILATQASYQYTGSLPALGVRLRLAATIVGLAVPLTLVLFVLFPRVEGPLWGLPQDAHAGRTGLSDTMEPGNISRLARSDAIAFRARFEAAPPAQAQLYWRAVVMSDYDGRTWRPRVGGERRPVNLELEGEPVRYQITLEPHGKRWVFVLDMPQQLPEIEGHQLRATSELQVLAARPMDKRVRYDGVSHLAYRLEAHADMRALSPWLALPSGYNPRSLALARELRSRSTSPEAAVATVLQMFRTQPFRYTLEPPLLGTHAVDDFLFGTRAGFCEHFSGAFVVLMRAMGIPARVVTGYQGGDINPADGYMAVRQSDAHAWAEVWMEGKGWLRVDPTAAVAPERIEQNLDSVIPRTALGGLIRLDASRNVLLAQWMRLRHSWEAINNSWNQWVLTYNPERQRDLLRRLGFEQPDWRAMAIALVVCGGLAAAFTVALALRRPRADPVDALYRRLCLRMERLGLPRLPHEGPRAYGARLCAPDSPLSASRKQAVTRFLTLYEALRYGAPDRAAPGSLANLKSLLSECR
jgi:protein-glutamine gamma-glutamyltransferase